MQAHDLPSDMDAKVSSPNYQKFLKIPGSTKVVELDAAPVEAIAVKLGRPSSQSLMGWSSTQVEQKLQDSAHSTTGKLCSRPSMAGRQN